MEEGLAEVDYGLDEFLPNTNQRADLMLQILGAAHCSRLIIRGNGGYPETPQQPQRNGSLSGASSTLIDLFTHLPRPECQRKPFRVNSLCWADQPDVSLKTELAVGVDHNWDSE